MNTKTKKEITKRVLDLQKAIYKNTEKSNYYIIPKFILKDKRLKLLDKLLYSIILSLSNNESGYCFASNKYFGELLDRKTDAISKSIKRLKKLKYINNYYDVNENKNCDKRKIYINTDFETLILNTHNNNNAIDDNKKNDSYDDDDVLNDSYENEFNECSEYNDFSLEGIIKNNDTYNDFSLEGIIENHKDNNILSNINTNKRERENKNEYFEYSEIDYKNILDYIKSNSKELVKSIVFRMLKDTAIDNNNNNLRLCILTVICCLNEKIINIDDVKKNDFIYNYVLYHNNLFNNKIEC